MSTTGALRRRLLVAAILAIAPLTLIACGGDEGDDPRRAAERAAAERWEIERRAQAQADEEARDLAREERIDDLERRLRRKDRRDSATAAPLPASTEPEGGRWTGTGTQYAPRGTTQAVALETELLPGGGGTHREYIRGGNRADDCEGSLARVRPGVYTYTERASRSCIARTTIQLTPDGDSLRFNETYSTSAGQGRVVGVLSRP